MGKELDEALEEWASLVETAHFYEIQGSPIPGRILEALDVLRRRVSGLGGPALSPFQPRR